MAHSVEKTRKAIAKKKGGKLGPLHENSRDNQRLRRAGMRDDKLAKLNSSRNKQQRPLMERTAYFQEAVRNNNSQPLEMEAIGALIEKWVHQYDEEFEAIKKERRPGRPSSTREDLLRMKIAEDLKEFDDGFFLPDLTDADNVTYLDRWDGTWTYLPTIKWVRISKAGVTTKSLFPPKGKS